MGHLARRRWRSEAVIIGLHLPPLARLFRVWPYYVTRALLALAAIVTMLAAPRTATINTVKRWMVVPATATAIILWLTAVTSLIMGWQLVKAAR